MKITSYFINTTELIKKHPILIILPFISSLVNYWLLKKFTPALSTGNFSITTTSFAVLLSIFILYYIYRVAFAKLSLSIIRKEDSPSIESLINFKHIITLLLLDIIIYTIGFIAFALFIIPGIFWFISIQFYIFILIDNKTTNKGILETIFKAINLSNGYKLPIFLIFIVYAVMNLIIHSLPFGFYIFLDPISTCLFLLFLVQMYNEASNKAENLIEINEK